MNKNQNKVVVSLLANTGIGNEVLRSLLSIPSVVVDSVVTRKFDSEYPYYNSKELYQEAESEGILCFTDIDVNIEYFNYIKKKAVDIILVASFNQIIKDNILNLPNTLIINYHPSLLPKYRGPSPIVWTILNNERRTGLTIHLLEKKIDAGDIIMQKELIIAENEFLGSLMLKISKLAGEMTYELIECVANNKLVTKRQIESESTYYKRPSKEREIYFNDAYEITEIKLRAFHPYPGALFIDEKGDSYLVKNYSMSNYKETSEINEILLIKRKSNILLNIKPLDENNKK